MKIFINNKEFKSEKYESFPELLNEVKSDLNNEILKSIQINEVEVNEKYLKESLIEKDDIKAIKFITQKNDDLVKNTLEEAKDYLPKLKDGVLEAASNFRNGNAEKANKLYQHIINGLEWYTDAITKVISILDDENFLEENNELIQGLNEKLAELMIAYNKGDYILLADILEYEMIDYIEKFINFNDKIITKLEERDI